MNVPLWAALPALVLAIAAAQADVRTRTIPNALTFPALLLGLAIAWGISRLEANMHGHDHGGGATEAHDHDHEGRKP